MNRHLHHKYYFEHGHYDLDEADTHRLFEAVYDGLTHFRRVLVVGHGKGKADAAAAFEQWWAKHHRETVGTIAGTETADIDDITNAQLLRWAEDYFGADQPEREIGLPRRGRRHRTTTGCAVPAAAGPDPDDVIALPHRGTILPSSRTASGGERGLRLRSRQRPKGTAMMEHVLITGGCGGIGAALAAEYHHRGAAVTVSDLPGALRADAVPGGVHLLACDVGDEAQVIGLVESAEEAAGPLSAVIANAGVPGGGGLDAPNAVWEQAWQVNVMAHVYLARAVVPRMVARGGGQFATLASAAGLLTNLGNAPYSVTKHAAAAFAEWLAIEHRDDGIDVRLIAPMGIDTPMLSAGAATLAGESVRALGVIEAARAARLIVDGLAGDRFLVLTHPEVARYEEARVTDRDAWLSGMRRSRTEILDRLGDRAAQWPAERAD